MRRLKVKKGALHGTINLSPSKSHSVRAVIYSAFAKGVSQIDNVLQSPDVMAAITACKLFGAKYTIVDKKLSVEGTNGQFPTPSDVINAQNSGLVLRFIGALSALSNGYTVITGDASIRSQRPVMPLIDAINDLGGFARSTRDNGLAPIIIKGPIHPGDVLMLGNDSQPISGMLMAMAFLDGPSRIDIKDVGEIPWLALTLSWFDRLNIGYINHDFSSIEIMGNNRIEGFHYTVPGDLSSVAFPVAAALITHSQLTICNVDLDDPQGDKLLLEALKKMGASITYDPSSHKLQIDGKNSHLRGVDVDINPFIDSITILAVIACFAEGVTKITGGAIARKKECDRIACIARELKKMGAKIEELEDGLIIENSPLTGANLHTYHDHRMVMSLTIAALGAEGESIIEGLDAIAKSYPNFVEDMRSLGAPLEIL